MNLVTYTYYIYFKNQTKLHYYYLFFCFHYFCPCFNLGIQNHGELFVRIIVNVVDSLTSHCVDKKHQCELCDKLFDSYRCLKEQITDINKDGSLYKCDDCIKIIHQETKIEPTCDSCGKTFTPSMANFLLIDLVWENIWNMWGSIKKSFIQNFVSLLTYWPKCKSISRKKIQFRKRKFLFFIYILDNK